jgi:hypothetical protein
VATVITAIVAGTETILTDEDPFWIESVDGWGMAPGHLLESRGPEQHGSTYEDFRLDPRELELIIGFMGTDAELLAYRRELLTVFQRRTDAMILRFTFDDGTVRQIDCRLASGLMLSRDGRDHNVMRAAAVLRCPDPTFYDPTAEAITFELGGGGGSGFIVPMPVPTEVGASTIDAGTSITYDGTWRSLPHLIRITGPITEFVLTNDTTGADLTAKAGITIAAGDYYDIDCWYGIATVVDSLGVSKIHNLTDTSELTTFAILPDPDAAGGINSISLTGSGVTAATNIQINYLNRYLGA